MLANLVDCSRRFDLVKWPSKISIQALNEQIIDTNKTSIITLKRE